MASEDNLTEDSSGAGSTDKRSESYYSGGESTPEGSIAPDIGAIKPYQFEPLLSDSSSTNESDDSEGEDRKNSTEW